MRPTYAADMETLKYPVPTRRRLLARLFYAGATGTAILASGFALADYPDRPIRLIVPYAAGGSADILARSYAEKLKDQLGQQILIDNKPGATGAIGTDAAAKAPGDGYTLVLNSSAIVINPWLQKQPFDFAKDLVPVARTAQTPYVLTVGASLPVHTLDEFIAYAKKHPGKVDCATYGIGSPPHIALELFKHEAGVDLVHVPYRTFAQALPDMLSGQLACSIDLPTVSAPHVKAGRLRALAHTGEGTMDVFPAAEPFGKRFAGATVVGWQAVFAPSSTPKPILDRLRAEWAKALASPGVVQKIREAGYQPATGSFNDFVKTIGADYEKFGRIVRERGIKSE